MKITVTSGSGEGNTTLSAFDTALKAAGVYNYNLIKLSSVIPPNTEIILEKWKTPREDHGKKLYVVLAEERSDQVGKAIAAGIGWYQIEDGRGVFVEHHTIVESTDEKEAERAVAEKIEFSIKDLCDNRNYPFEKKKMKMLISSKQVGKKPACALVIAVYESSSWLI